MRKDLGVHVHVNWSYIDFSMDFGNLSNNCISFFHRYTLLMTFYVFYKGKKNVDIYIPWWWIMIVKHSIILCFISHFSLSVVSHEYGIKPYHCLYGIKQYHCLGLKFNLPFMHYIKMRCGCNNFPDFFRLMLDCA